jgi:hypothetical protein
MSSMETEMKSRPSNTSRYHTSHINPQPNIKKSNDCLLGVWYQIILMNKRNKSFLCLLDVNVKTNKRGTHDVKTTQKEA